MDWLRLKSAFGEIVRRRRQRLGVSQEAFAHSVGVHRTYMGAIERGERNVSLQNLVRVANALDASLSSLIRDAERLATESR